MISPPGLVWPNANWNVRQGAAGEAKVPLSVPLPETKVTGEAASAGRGVKQSTKWGESGGK